MIKKEIKFRVTEICDTRKSGSSIEIGKIFTGVYNGINSVSFDDKNGQSWIFYVGETCEIVSKLEQKSK